MAESMSEKVGFMEYAYFSNYILCYFAYLIDFHNHL